METPVVKLLIQAGLIPENVVEQLKRWKLLKPETGQALGHPDGTFELAWDSAEDFVKELQRLIHEENLTIRETELAISGTFKKVWLLCEDGRGKPACLCIDAVVDKLGRVFVASRLLGLNGVGGWTIKSVSFAEHSTDVKAFRPVARTEIRYEGEKEIAHVVYLVEEAARVPVGGDASNGAHPPD